MRAITSIEVRVAGKRDAEAIAHLAGQLGYPSTAKQVRERLEALEKLPQNAAFVATARGGEVVGWIQLSEVCSLDADARAEIASLIVDAENRSSGVGRLLVERGEAWARDRGLNIIGVHSNVVRERAHRFYERLGYVVIKSQEVFRKTL